MRLHTVQKDDIFFPRGKRAALVFKEHLSFSDEKQQERIQTCSSYLVLGAAGIEGFQADIEEIIFCKYRGGVDKDSLRLQNIPLQFDYIFFRYLPHSFLFSQSVSHAAHCQCRIMIGFAYLLIAIASARFLFSLYHRC